MSPRFLFVAGGTGGHVFPALAVADALRAECPEAWVHFVGGRRGIEGELVPAAGHTLTRLPAAGMRGLGLMGAIRFVVSFKLAFVYSSFALLRWRPDVVLATGGYASAAPSVAAAVFGRPLWLQEQNSSPGSTNRMLSRFAERVFLAFEGARAPLGRARRIDQVPNPVRRDLRESGARAAKDEDYAALGLEPGRPTLFVFGGSRGARSINRAFAAAWPRLKDETEWQVLIQTGKQDLESTRAVVNSSNDGDASRVRVLPFVDDMGRAYRVADLVVCRAGALTLAELCAVGKAAVLVPFPHATDDHQTRNAREVESAGAALCVADAEFDGERLMALLHELGADPDRRARMARAASALGAHRDGAKEIAAAMLERAGVRRAA